MGSFYIKILKFNTKNIKKKKNFLLKFLILLIYNPTSQCNFLDILKNKSYLYNYKHNLYKFYQKLLNFKVLNQSSKYISYIIILM